MFGMGSLHCFRCHDNQNFKIKKEHKTTWSDRKTNKIIMTLITCFFPPKTLFFSVLKCEYCKNFAPATQFRGTKRFCSMSCAKRYFFYMHETLCMQPKPYHKQCTALNFCNNIFPFIHLRSLSCRLVLI